MPIFIDPTENRNGTRLPQAVIDQAQVLPCLESYTGADLLISPLALPLKELNDSVPSQRLLRKHIDAGLLVQRKTGRDLVNSIPHYAEIVHRMRQWTMKPVLLFVGDLKVDRDGQAIIDGNSTGWTYKAVKGAIRWWELRGGLYEDVLRDGMVAGWINDWLDVLRKLQDPVNGEYKIIHRVPSQVVVSADWTDTLATFPGIGSDRAKAIAEHCGTLARALEWLSNPTSTKINGVGDKTHDAARRYMGLEEGLSLSVGDAEIYDNLQTLLKQIGTESVCKACGAEIYWITTKNNKPAPITPRGLNHFADCEHADEFRKKGTK